MTASLEWGAKAEASLMADSAAITVTDENFMLELDCFPSSLG